MLVDDKLAKEKLARICEDYAKPQQEVAWMKPSDIADICAQLIRNTDLTDCQLEDLIEASKKPTGLIRPAPDQGSVRNATDNHKDYMSNAKANVPPSISASGKKCPEGLAIRSMMHALNFLPYGHFIVEFEDDTQIEFDDFAEFSAFIMQRERTSNAICDELAAVLRGHNKYQTEMEEAGFGVYSASDLCAMTNAVLATAIRALPVLEDKENCDDWL